MKHFTRKPFVTVLIGLAIIVATTCFATEPVKININTASIEQLMTLDRVGPKYAQRIIDYRETEGPFKRPEDIMLVPGIGRKTWEANKDRIII